MRVLVTGGAGFIGTNLIKRLLELEHTVISIDNYHTGLESNHQRGCKYLNHDIFNLREFPPVDIVFHLAAVARIQPSFKEPKKYFLSNANATFNLAEWCAKNNTPIVYSGSSSKHSGRFKNPYTFSKDIGEDVITLFQSHFGLQASVARFYNVYGPYQLTQGGYTTLIGRWINNIENNIECEIYGDGEQRRDFTHVDDIVEALLLIMDNKAYGYSFELGRGKNHSVNEIANMFGISPRYVDPKPGEAKITLNTSNEAKQVLGWNPQKNIVDYINNFMECKK